MIKTALTLALFLSSTSFAAGVYEFGGGSCPSQGEWTRRALEQTKAISAAFNQLKNNPACKGLEQAISGVEVNVVAAQEELQSEPEEQQVQSRVESLPGETEALQNAVMVPGASSNLPAVVDPTIASMLTTRSLEAASINSSLQQSTTLASPAGLITPMLSKEINLDAMLKRLAKPTKAGLQMITNVMNVLPQLDECLIGAPATGLAVIGGVVKIAGAFSSNGNGVANGLGNAIAGLMKMMQERKFTQALRAQDQSQFWESILCLVESTSKNYCDAQNAQDLLLYSKNQYDAKVQAYETDQAQSTYDNPLEGYYLLVRELPIIATWLQKVIFGVTPQLSTDATFKNSVWEETTELTKLINKLYGYFNEQMLFMRSLKDAPSKRNHLLQMVGYIYGQMSGEANSGGGTKFFTTSVNDNLMPYYLIGKDSVPSETMNIQYGMGVEWQTWMKNGGPNNGFIPDFSDPDALAQTVQARMDDLIDQASQKGSEYFRERLVVDVTNLVDQTHDSQFLTTNKAFESVYNYLSRFETKLRASDDYSDVILLPSVRETKQRVKRFLDSYQKRHELGLKVLKSENDDAFLREQLIEASKAVVYSAFDEFNALYQRNMFLTSRLDTFIKRDFSIRIRKGMDMSAHVKDVLTIAQDNMLDVLKEVHGIKSNPTAARIDLANAQLVNKRNIDSLSSVFTDSMYRMMVDLKATIMGTGAFGVNQMLDKKKANLVKQYTAYYLTIPPYKYDPMGEYGLAFAPMKAIMPLVVSNARPDLFAAPVSVNINLRDSVHGDTAIVLAQACADTLAFENRSFFIELCRGAVIPSFYTPYEAPVQKSSGGIKSASFGVKSLNTTAQASAKTNFDFKYDEYLNFKNADDIKKSAVLTSQNICAYNNFRIKNMVQYLRDQDAKLVSDLSSGQ